MNRYTYLVTVETDTEKHAKHVLSERLYHEEDYGFTYSVDYGDLLYSESVEEV